LVTNEIPGMLRHPHRVQRKQEDAQDMEAQWRTVRIGGGLRLSRQPVLLHSLSGGHGRTEGGESGVQEVTAFIAIVFIFVVPVCLVVLYGMSQSGEP
jgi:hypothetical protein